MFSFPFIHVIYVFRCSLFPRDLNTVQYKECNAIICNTSRTTSIPTKIRNLQWNSSYPIVRVPVLTASALKITEDVNINKMVEVILDKYKYYIPILFSTGINNLNLNKQKT